MRAEIHAEVQRADLAWRSGLSHAIRAGDLLIEVRRRVGHGAFGPGLRANFSGSPREAQRYMRVARNASRVSYMPSLREALEALAEQAPLLVPSERRVASAGTAAVPLKRELGASM